jgi:hypothetical protein
LFILKGWQGGQVRDSANVSDAAGETRPEEPDACAEWWKASDQTRLNQRRNVDRIIVSRYMSGESKREQREKH